MGKIFAQPAAAAAPSEPLFRSLWDVQPGFTSTTRDKPRSASSKEVRAYLLTLAMRRGVHVPDNATIGDAGIYVEGHGYIVPMPGYGDDRCVVLEELDEAGGVVRTSRIGLNKHDGIGLNAAAVVKACAIPQVVKPRGRKAKVAPVAAAEPAQAVSNAPAPKAPDTTADALSERVAALEAIVARLSRPVVAGKRQRSETERRAIIRAWRMRGEARACADLDRRALLAANEANRMLLEKLGQAEHSRDIARAGVAANLATVDAAERRAAAAIGKRARTARRLVTARAGARTAQREARGLATGLAQAQGQLARLQPLADALAGLLPAAAAPVTGGNVVSLAAAR